MVFTSLFPYHYQILQLEHGPAGQNQVNQQFNDVFMYLIYSKDHVFIRAQKWIIEQFAKYIRKSIVSTS